MNIEANRLDEFIEVFKNDFSDLNESLTSIRISDDKWTLKEIIGHLVDSASNNHQRFIRLQLSDELEFPDYKNTEWLRIQKYQDMEFKQLLSLFYYYNKLLVNTILNVDEKCLQNRWNISWDENSTYIRLENLIIHYVDHLKSHMDHFNKRFNEVKNSE